MRTGKVAIFTEPQAPMEFREYPVPSTEPDDLLVKMSMANICGSDLHFWRGHGPKIASGIPQVLGHEMVGTIEELGKNIQHDSMGQPLEEGDRITYSYFKPCNHCWNLPQRQNQECANRYRDWLGVPSDQSPHFHGGLRRVLLYETGDTGSSRSPDELPDALVSPVNCALSEVIYGLNQIGVTLGDTVVIQGAGGLGLYATAVAKEMGAGQVIVLDRLPARLNLAREFGADHLINVDQLSVKDRVEYVLDHTRGVGADLVAEFVGSPRVLSEGVEMLRWGGRYLWIGNINLGMPTEIDPGSIVRCSRTIRGVIVYEGWVIARALDFLQRTQDKYPFYKIMSHTFPFDQINEAFEFAEGGRSNSCRADVLSHESINIGVTYLSS